MATQTQKKTHKKQKNSLIRFLLILLILVAYAGFTIYEYGVSQGLGVTGLTWAFFVFATPIADAGFLLAFPIRLLSGVRMLHTQIGVWLFGALLVGYYLSTNPDIFMTTGILELFHTILTTPWPLWLILILSFVGTLVSIIFDDDVVDVVGAKNKKRRFGRAQHTLYLTVAIFAVTVIAYIFLLRTTHIDIKLL